jgi:hypothetical protein
MESRNTDLGLYLKTLEELTAFGVDPQLVRDFCGHVEKTWRILLKIRKDSPHVSLVVEMDPSKQREIYLRTVEP